jgi:hypothetical protein
MTGATPGLKFVCLRDDRVLRVHMYTGGGTLMSSLESKDARELKAITTAWLRSRGLPFDEAALDAAIGRVDGGGEPAP